MDKRDSILPVRFSKQERQKLKKLANFYDRSEASYIRWKLFNDHKEILKEDGVNGRHRGEDKTTDSRGNKD